MRTHWKRGADLIQEMVATFLEWSVTMSTVQGPDQHAKARANGRCWKRHQSWHPMLSHIKIILCTPFTPKHFITTIHVHSGRGSPWPDTHTLRHNMQVVVPMSVWSCPTLPPCLGHRISLKCKHGHDLVNRSIRHRPAYALGNKNLGTDLHPNPSHSFTPPCKPQSRSLLYRLSPSPCLSSR